MEPADRQEIADGAWWYRGLLDRSTQEGLVASLRAIAAEAPFFVPEMPRSGRKFSVRMTNCGELGWVSDRDGGYRYQAHHPLTGKPWPAMPAILGELWEAVAFHPHGPEACLVNFYDGQAKMGMHQDRDEACFEAPVVSVSLGDSCRFRIGGTERGGPTRSVRLDSGDVVVMGGASRLAYHGVDRVYAGSSTLLERGGRINLTLRRVTMAPGNHGEVRMPG